MTASPQVSWLSSHTGRVVRQVVRRTLVWNIRLTLPPCREPCRLGDATEVIGLNVAEAAILPHSLSARLLRNAKRELVLIWYAGHRAGGQDGVLTADSSP